MTMAAMLLPEFDHEMRTTRTVLERTPAQDAAWRPHPRSTSLGDLAVHIATIPSWLVPVLNQTELDLAPKPGTAPAGFASVDELLAMFDENVRRARAALAAASDADFGVPWTLRAGERTVFTMPRGPVVRSFIMSHLVHHRGQFTVYLRLRDVPLPSVYGPTADA
jgi:uncharacterized damage-inducible protein DinB